MRAADGLLRLQQSDFGSVQVDNLSEYQLLLHEVRYKVAFKSPSKVIKTEVTLRLHSPNTLFTHLL